MTDLTSTLPTGDYAAFDKLLQLDMTGQSIASILNSVTHGKHQDGERNDGADAYLVGSVLEGSWTSHFLCDNDFHLECDVMMILGITEPELLERSSHHTGHYVIDNIHLEEWKAHHMYADQMKSQQFVKWGQCNIRQVMVQDDLKRTEIFWKTGKVMASIFNILIYTDKDSSIARRGLFILICKLFRSVYELLQCRGTKELVCTDGELLKLDTTSGSISVSGMLHGPARSYTMSLSDNERNKSIRGSMDEVHALEMPDWPSDLQKQKRGWISRNRSWPNAGIIQKAVQMGCQLVAKPLKQSEGLPKWLEQGKSEWRLSFTKAENVLAQARTKSQKLVYLVVKALFYVHVKPAQEGRGEVPSYALKTCMMWLLEQEPVDQWTEHNVLEMTRLLMGNFADALEKGHLSHYFLPEINILSEVMPEMLGQYRERVVRITSNLSHYIHSVTCRTKRLEMFIETKSNDLEFYKRLLKSMKVVLNMTSLTLPSEIIPFIWLKLAVEILIYAFAQA